MNTPFRINAVRGDGGSCKLPRELETPWLEIEGWDRRSEHLPAAFVSPGEGNLSGECVVEVWSGGKRGELVRERSICTTGLRVGKSAEEAVVVGMWRERMMGVRVWRASVRPNLRHHLSFWAVCSASSRRFDVRPTGSDEKGVGHQALEISWFLSALGEVKSEGRTRDQQFGIYFAVEMQQVRC